MEGIPSSLPPFTSLGLTIAPHPGFLYEVLKYCEYYDGHQLISEGQRLGKIIIVPDSSRDSYSNEILVENGPMR